MEFCDLYDVEELSPQGPHPFWAKLGPEGSGTWHSIEHHAADVAACTRALLEETLLGQRLARAAGVRSLHPGQVDRLCALAAFHDIGKFNLGFQNRALPGRSPRLGHVGPALALLDFNHGIPETYRLDEAMDLDTHLDWGTANIGFDLLVATLGHHGRRIRPSEAGRVSRSIWASRGGCDPFAGIERLASQVRNWFPDAYGADVPPFPDRPELAHAFNGLLTLADWLGSDDRPDFFPLANGRFEQRYGWALQRARRLLDALGVRVKELRSGLPSPRIGMLLESDWEPRPVQEQVFALPTDHSPSLVILEAETGAGKTEAAMGRFLRLFQAGKVDGMYFALPTRTAATQIHRRVHEMVSRLDLPRPLPVVLAVPGYIQVDAVRGTRPDPEHPQLPRFEVLWPDDERERYRFRGWAAEHPKRFLAASIAVGTIDQALLSVLQVRHSHLRATALSRQLLVVDEVHASDAYMTRLTEALLDRHLSLGGHALLMSATLGSSARHRLLDSAFAQPSSSTGPDLDQASRVPYPAVFYRPSEDRPQEHPVRDDITLARRIYPRLVPLACQPERIAERALAAAADGARVLVIRNKVDDCVATQRALEETAALGDRTHLLFCCAGQPAPHHSRYARPDRLRLDARIEQVFGKDRSGPGCVAVATQTVQQSLDIDADLMLSDLCPIDVLLQRAGRLHRHRRQDRPPGCQRARLEILVPEERDFAGWIHKNGEGRGPHGYGTVYEDLRVLDATWSLLEGLQEVRIPQDCRRLVERGTHPKVLSARPRQDGGAWTEHEQRVKAARFNREQVARLGVESWTIPWATGTQPAMTRDAEQRHTTRLGTRDRLARFDPPVPGAFAEAITAIPVPGWLLGEADPSEELPVEVESQSDHFVKFLLGKTVFQYDRLGLRPGAD